MSTTTRRRRCCEDRVFRAPVALLTLTLFVPLGGLGCGPDEVGSVKAPVGMAPGESKRPGGAAEAQVGPADDR